MKTTVFMMAICFLLVLLCNGCSTYGNLKAPVLLTDRLPKDKSKGYAEFYAAYGKSHNSQIRIYQIENDEAYFAGKTCWGSGFGSGYARRRVACAPGTNVFIVKAGSVEKRVAVNVNDGMVTPVRLTIISVNSGPWIWNKNECNFDIKVEDAVRLEQHNPRIGQDYTSTPPGGKSETARLHSTSMYVMKQYQISGATFNVFGEDVRHINEAQALLDRAAKGLDLTGESDKAEFLKRYKQERGQHPELQVVVISCPSIDGL